MVGHQGSKGFVLILRQAFGELTYKPTKNDFLLEGTELK